MTVPLRAWGATFGVLAVLIAADLMLTRTAAGLRAAALLSAGWIAAAVAFGGTLWWWRGPSSSGGCCMSGCWARSSCAAPASWPAAR